MSEDNDKTVRLDSNEDNDKTVRIEDNDKTVRIDNDSEKTTRLNDDVISADGGQQNNSEQQDTEKTTRLNDDVIPAEENVKKEIKANTIKQDPNKKEEKRKFRGPEKFELLSGVYENERILSTETGEASIYLVKKDGKESVLKLYFHDMKPKLLILKKLQEKGLKGIIQTSDFGLTELGGEERYYELMEFARGGTLDATLPIRDEKKLKVIIEKVANSLKDLHDINIIHKDIKPGNIFLRSENSDDYIIGDFGISSIMDEEADRLRTKQNRTDIFAAPEVYLSMGNHEMEITPGVDWYALGISILFLWTGHDPYRGVPYGSLANEKLEAKFRFPDDMPENFRNFVRGCCVPLYTKRWGFDEIKKWLKGENVPIYQEEKKMDYEPFNFDAQAGLVAKTPEELAGMMEKDPELAKKYLYKGKIKEWLEQAEMNRLAMFVDDIPEKMYPKNEDAGLKAAIYLLDPEKQFVGLNGKVCETDVDFAELFLDNFNEYEEILTDKDADFYIYLRARQLGEKVNEFLGIFEQYSAMYGLYKIIYTLNPSAPFRYLYQKKDKKWYSRTLNSLDSVCEYLHKYNSSSEGMFFYGYIQLWLEARQDAEDISQEEVERILDLINWSSYIMKEYEKNHSAGLRLADYVFNPDMGFLSKDNETVCHTREEIGHEIISYADEYTELLQDANSDINLFIKSKVWGDVADYITAAYNLEHHEDKLGPYTAFTGTAKIVKYLGITISYTVKDNWYNTPEELLKAPSSVRKSLKEDVEYVDSGFMAWLSTFYQESPEVDQDDSEYAYEDKLLEMFEYLVKLNTGADITKRYDKAKKLVAKRVKKEKAADRRFLIAKIVALILPLLSAGALFYYVNEKGVSFLESAAFWDAGMSYYLLFMTLFTLYYLFSGGFGQGWGFSDGCLGAPIIGIILAVIVYYIFYFTVGSPYIFGAIMLVILIVGYVKIFGASHSDSGVREEIFDTDDRVTFEFEPLSYALGDDEEFSSQRLDVLDQYRYARSFSWKTLLKYGFLPSIIFLGSLGLLVSNDPAVMKELKQFKSISSFVENIIPSFTSIPDMKGMWEGNYNKTTMMMNVTSQEKENLEANISILYRNQQHFSAKGTVTGNDVKLTDNKGGVYTGTYDDDTYTITGEYALAGKISDFTLTMKDAPKKEVEKKDPAPVKKEEPKQTESKPVTNTQQKVTEQPKVEEPKTEEKPVINPKVYKKLEAEMDKLLAEKKESASNKKAPVTAPATVPTIKKAVANEPKVEKKPEPVIDYIATKSDRGFKVDILACRRVSSSKLRINFRFTNTSDKSKAVSLAYDYFIVQDARGNEYNVSQRVLGNESSQSQDSNPSVRIEPGKSVTGSAIFNGFDSNSSKVRRFDLRARVGGYTIYEFKNLEIK